MGDELGLAWARSLISALLVLTSKGSYLTAFGDGGLEACEGLEL